jgi:hypothetical protein
LILLFCLWQLVKDFFIIFTKKSQFRGLACFVAEQSHDFVGYGFLAVRVEINLNSIGRFADCLYKVGLFGSRRWGGRFVCIHIGFLSALLRYTGLQPF